MRNEHYITGKKTKESYHIKKIFDPTATKKRVRMWNSIVYCFHRKQYAMMRVIPNSKLI